MLLNKSFNPTSHALINIIYSGIPMSNMYFILSNNYCTEEKNMIKMKIRNRETYQMTNHALSTCFFDELLAMFFCLRPLQSFPDHDEATILKPSVPSWRALGVADGWCRRFRWWMVEGTSRRQPMKCNKRHDEEVQCIHPGRRYARKGPVCRRL